MKRKVMKPLMIAVTGAFFAFTSAVVIAQNTNSATGQMQETGKETKRAGKSMAKNVKHGRVVKGSKHFGKHMGKAGKHFGSGTKKAVKKIIP